MTEFPVAESRQAGTARIPVDARAWPRTGRCAPSPRSSVSAPDPRWAWRSPAPRTRGGERGQAGRCGCSFRRPPPAMTIHSPPSAAASSTGGCPGSIRHEKEQWGQPLAPWSQLEERLYLDQLSIEEESRRTSGAHHSTRTKALFASSSSWHLPARPRGCRYLGPAPDPLSATPATQGDGWRARQLRRVAAAGACPLLPRVT